MAGSHWGFVTDHNLDKSHQDTTIIHRVDPILSKNLLYDSWHSRSHTATVSFPVRESVERRTRSRTHSQRSPPCGELFLHFRKTRTDIQGFTNEFKMITNDRLDSVPMT
ncbi:hypothetical protein V1478_016131 [Vespula squamosa]|uniref:Uncharacterized protein n=1 Tax=Vespula squamosa TaxID=30214 RepID=A0ABD1ZYZ0_VESSQ